MSKRPKNQSIRQSNDYWSKRAPSVSATRQGLVTLPSDLLSYPTLVRSLLPEVEDYRIYNPDDYVTPRTTRSRAMIAETTRRQVNKPFRSETVFRFENARNVIICHRRKTRREVLHALSKTGKGGGKKKRYRRNMFSDVRC